MPHYKNPEPNVPRPPARLALDPAGQYTNQEVVSLPDSADKKKGNKKKRPKPNPEKVLSWRKDSVRTNSESSDSLQSHRSSEFKLLSETNPLVADRHVADMHESEKSALPSFVPILNTASNQTQNGAVKHVGGSTCQTEETPWFQKFETGPPCVVKRKTGLK